MEHVCETCRRPEGAANHVPGHVFVGWGQGWQPCPDCGGTSIKPQCPNENDVAAYVSGSATPTEIAKIERHLRAA